jgi:dienelactone hydrolase
VAETIVRSVHRAGAGGLRVTLFYPADPRDLPGARLTGILPVATDSRLPGVVIMPGVNVTPDSYRWLASELAAADLVVAVYSLVEDLGPLGHGITPGFDLAALAPEALGTRPSASVLGDVIDLLTGDPLLGDHVDPDRLALGGHSAGGTMALQNAQPAWFPGTRAAFAYAGHTMAATRLGYEEAAVMPVPSATPLLLLSGANDGVIAASRDRYRSGDGRHDPVRSTFEEAVTAEGGDCWFVELADGTHFTACDPIDHTSARSFLEPAEATGQAGARRLLADLVLAFLVEHLGDGPATLGDLVGRPGVSAWARR